MRAILLVLVDDAISAHQRKNTPLILVESSWFDLNEEGPQVLGLWRSQMVSFNIKLSLQFLHFLQIFFKIIDVNFCHDFPITVTDLCVNLDHTRFTWGLCSFKNYVKTLNFPRTFFCIIWILVLGLLSKAICSNRNYLSLIEALAFSFSSSGCSSLTAFESGAIRLLFK